MYFWRPFRVILRNAKMHHASGEWVVNRRAVSVAPLMNSVLVTKTLLAFRGVVSAVTTPGRFLLLFITGTTLMSASVSHVPQCFVSAVCRCAVQCVHKHKRMVHLAVCLLHRYSPNIVQHTRPNPQLLTSWPD
jgi:hypothetical protein